MRRATVILVSCLALTGLAACGSNDNGGDNTDDAGQANPATTPPPTRSKPAANTVKVTIKDIKFLPHDVTVKEGQKIRWTNDDSVPHTVTAKSNADFDEMLKPGSFFETTLRNAGKIDYVCTIHPGQTGTITIVPA